MSADPPSPSPEAVAAVVEACADADGVSPLEHFPPGGAAAAFGAEVDGHLAAVAVVAAGQVWHLALATHPALRGRGAGMRAAAAAVAHVDTEAGPVRTDMWVPGAGSWAAEALAFGLDFALTRRLLRLEVDLAAVPAPVWPVGYAPDTLADGDVDAVVAVNNRAFAWHEDQGSWTVPELRRRLGEPWVDRSGFLVARGPDGVAGFCWTKLHAKPRPVGEIYVICADPAHAGHGLGRALTLAGLVHLARSTDVGMLYVDDANLPARRTYRHIGFRLARVDARYTRDLTAPAFDSVVPR